MKLNHRLVAALLVTALAIPGVALAAKGEGKKGGKPAFGTLDKNGDGSISEAEFVAARGKKTDEGAAKTQFGKLDKNGDGKVSQEEFDAPAGKGEKKRKKN